MRNLNWSKISGVVLAVGIIIFIFFINKKGEQIQKLLKDDGLFTIGTLRSYSSSTYGTFLRFDYNIEGDIYNGNVTVDITKKEFREIKGLRFYVKYLSDQPKHGKPLIFMPVPDRIKVAPSAGWEKIPVVDYEKVTRFNLGRFKE